jgi:hypothetical protein
MLRGRSFAGLTLVFEHHALRDQRLRRRGQRNGLVQQLSLGDNDYVHRWVRQQGREQQTMQP